MKKTTRFILIMVFVILAVRCSVSAINPSNYSVCVVPELHIYTEEEQQQIRQNLLGSYQYQQNMIMIRENTVNLYRLFVNRIEFISSYPYTVDFPVFLEPIIVFNETNIYYIESDANNPTQILGFRSAINHELYYRRLENNENNNPHDEL